MAELEKNLATMSVLDIFAQTQETYEEAQQKSNEENRKRAAYLRFAKDGTYNVRILPLAPVINAEGEVLPLERKGYEYPLRSLMLKVESTGKDGKVKVQYVTACNAKYVFGDKLNKDLIDAYVEVASEKYGDDEALIKKLRSNSFDGGLKWDSKRCMYVIDCDNPGDGIQILQLSYAQYKEIEERKFSIWQKLNKSGRVPCPISSIYDAYPIEIKRTTENKKVNYQFSVDTISGKMPLDENTLTELLNQPRLPEAIYRYTRFHLEGTIAYLKQLDNKYKIDVMSSEEIEDVIEQIKCLLPADDTSHFSMGGGEDNGSATSSETTIDDLWDIWDTLDKEGLDDKTAEGQELRTSIREYIDDHDLNIRVARDKTNKDLLNEIEDVLDEQKEEEPKKEVKHEVEEEPVEPGEPEYDDDDEEDDDEPMEPEEVHTPSQAPVERERNDDTSEPAERRTRRTSRPARRR